MEVYTSHITTKTIEIIQMDLCFLNIDTYQNYYRHKPIDLCPECMCNMKLIIDVVKKKSKMLDSEKSCESCMFEKVNENDWVCSDCSGQNWFPKKPEDFLEEN